MLPNRARKDRCKDPNGTAKGDRQGEHDYPFDRGEHGGALPINFDANCEKWIKSSLDGIWEKLLCQVTPSYARMLWQRTSLLQGVLRVSHPTLLLAPGSCAAQTAA
jgi:hypothetical protein